MTYQTISQEEWDSLSKRHKPTIKLTPYDRVYRISSQTKEGTFYTVDTVKNSCSCPAGTYNKNCWHKGYVGAYDQWRMQQQQKAS